MPEQARRTPFQVSNQAMDAKLWVFFTQQMHVVGHDFQLDYGSLKLLGGLVDDFFRTLIHAVDHHLAAIFRTPDNMILTGIDDIAVFEALLIIRTHVLYYTTTSRITQTLIRRCALPPYIPMAKARGFTADFG